MKRIAFASAATAVVLLLGACGSDEKTSSTPAAETTTANDGSGASDATTGDADTDVSFPAVSISDEDIDAAGDVLEGSGLSDECKEVYGQFVAAMGSVAGTGSGAVSGISDAFANLAAVVPDELKADVQLLSQAYAPMEEFLAKYDGDITKAMSDPDAMAAFSQLSTPEVTAASANISKYFESSCPTG